MVHIRVSCVVFVCVGRVSVAGLVYERKRRGVAYSGNMLFVACNFCLMSSAFCERNSRARIFAVCVRFDPVGFHAPRRSSQTRTR